MKKKSMLFSLLLLFGSSSQALLLRNATGYNIVIIKKSDVIFNEDESKALDIKPGAKPEKVTILTPKNIIPEYHYCIFCKFGLFSGYLSKVKFPYSMYIVLLSGTSNLYWKSYLPIPYFPDLKGPGGSFAMIDCSEELFKKLEKISKTIEEPEGEL